MLNAADILENPDSVGLEFFVCLFVFFFFFFFFFRLAISTFRSAKTSPHLVPVLLLHACLSAASPDRNSQAALCPSGVLKSTRS